MTEPITSLSAERRRIDFTGTIWFGTAAIASSIGLGLLLASGWRPGTLPAIADVVWWVGAAISVGAMVLLAWAGCPVFSFTPERVDRQKSLSIRVGVTLYLGGNVLAAFAVLVSPAAG